MESCREPTAVRRSLFSRMMRSTVVFLHGRRRFPYCNWVRVVRRMLLVPLIHSKWFGDFFHWRNAKATLICGKRENLRHTRTDRLLDPVSHSIRNLCVQINNNNKNYKYRYTVSRWVVFNSDSGREWDWEEWEWERRWCGIYRAFRSAGAWKARSLHLAYPIVFISPVSEKHSENHWN